MKQTVMAALLSTICTLFSCKQEAPQFTPVTHFDLNRYLGTWYEIARLPTSFEKDMQQVTANYSLKSDGTVQVLNQGMKKGKPTKAVGKAIKAGNASQGYLRVSFFGPFFADYIVVELADDYSYAMVASSKEYLWILSRSPTLDKATLDMLLEKAKTLGFTIEKLIFTQQ